MEDKYISGKVAYIYEQFLEILLMQIRSLYEEYDDTYLDEFELKYRESYRDLINKVLTETDLEDKIKNLILTEMDPYGLDTTENDIRFIISDIFRNVGIELSIESLMIKDKWKADQVGKLTSEISNLSEQVKLHKSEVDKLNDDIDKEKDENVNLKLQIDYTMKKLELAEKNNEKKIKHYEAEIKKYKNKLDEIEKESIKSSKEKEALKAKIKELETDISSINSEAIAKQNDDHIKVISKLKKERDHFKGGIDLLKSKSIEKERELNQLIDKKDKIELENKKLEDILSEKDREIKLLQRKIKKLSSVELAPRITIEEIEEKYNGVCEALRKQLREILRDKVIEGKRTMPIASDIDKLARSIKSINNITEFKNCLDKLISELAQFDNLFERNDKNSGLMPYIDKLKKLKVKI